MPNYDSVQWGPTDDYCYWSTRHMPKITRQRLKRLAVEKNTSVEKLVLNAVEEFLVREGKV